MTAAQRTFRIVPAAFVVAGWLVGALEALTLSIDGSRGVVLVFSALIASVPGLILGVIALGVAAAMARWAPSAWRQRIGEISTRSRDHDRAPVIRLHAFVLAGLVLTLLSGVVAALVYPALFQLQVETLAHQLAAAGAVALVVGTLVVITPLARLLEVPLAQLDARWALPLPPQPALRFLLFVAIPAFALLYPFVRTQGPLIGKLGDVLAILLLALAGLQLALALKSWRVLAIGAPVVAVIALAAGLALYHRFATPAAAAEKGIFAALGARIIRAASDFDRDGASPLLGGGDCAPFDASRSPTATEVFGNGIDEDCDGADAAPSAPGDPGQRELFSGAISKRQQKHYNIVWIVIDSLRADHLSLYGYGKPTSPNIDALANESLVFTRALSQASATAMSFPSMFTGTNPGELRWWVDVNDAQKKNKEQIPQVSRRETLFAERLKPLGYDTGAVLTSYTIIGTIHLTQGIDKVVDAGKTSTRRNPFNRRSPVVTARALDWIADHVVGERSKPPFFLMLFYPDPHIGYVTQRDLIGGRSFGKDDKGRYDSEIAFVDQHLGVLIGGLKARPFVWDDTIVVITGDHGEEFREHGGISHATTCHVESLHVPLIVRIPGVEPKRIDTPVALVDVVPTILEMLGVQSDLDRLSGQSLLVPALSPEHTWPNRPVFCSVASQKASHGEFFRRAVRQNGFALLHDVHTGRYTFFDTTRDPREQHNLIDSPEHAARIEAMKKLLRDSYTGNLNDYTRLADVTSD